MPSEPKWFNIEFKDYLSDNDGQRHAEATSTAAD